MGVSMLPSNANESIAAKVSAQSNSFSAATAACMVAIMVVSFIVMVVDVAVSSILATVGKVLLTSSKKAEFAPAASAVGSSHAPNGAKMASPTSASGSLKAWLSIAVAGAKSSGLSVVASLKTPGVPSSQVDGEGKAAVGTQWLKAGWGSPEMRAVAPIVPFSWW